MSAKWKKNKNLKPSVILEKIDSLKQIVDGRLQFTGFEHDDAEIALESMIEFSEIAEDLDKPKLISSTLWEVARCHSRTDEKTFMSKLNEKIKAEFAKRENTYYLLTSLSLSNIKIRKFDLNGCTIRFYKSKFPSKFKGRNALVRSKLPNSLVDTSNYTKVVLEIRAKSEYIAVSKALKALDLFRSFFSVFCNSKSELFGNSWEPINRVRLGEYHTLHDSSGDVYPQTFWYDPSFVKAINYRIPNDIVMKNVKFIDKSLSKLTKRYKAIIIDGLLRYVRALDERNQNIAMLGAWGALESVSSPNESNGDSVTKRCSFLFEESTYHKQILEHLREYRNRNVHAGEESTKAKQYTFQVQEYFVQLILFHARRAGTFDSLDDANRFLDLPTGKSALLKSQALINSAIKFRCY